MLLRPLEKMPCEMLALSVHEVIVQPKPELTPKVLPLALERSTVEPSSTRMPACVFCVHVAPRTVDCAEPAIPCTAFLCAVQPSSVEAATVKPLPPLPSAPQASIWLRAATMP